jgi:hypothetical protein
MLARKYRRLTGAISVAALLLAGAAAAQPAAAAQLLADDFDGAPLGAPPPGWTVNDTGGSVAVQAVPTAGNPANRAMCATRDTVNTPLSTQHVFSPASGVVTTEARLRAAQTDALFYGPVLQDSLGRDVIQLGFHHENGQFSGLTSWWTGFVQYQANIWYDLRVVADVDTDTYDLFWNGTLVRSAEPFKNAADDLAAIKFTGYAWTLGSACYDDVVVDGDGGGGEPGGWPGADGKSGVNANNEGITIANIEAFCNWRGRACDVTVTPTTRSTWDTMTGAGGAWLFDRLAAWPGQLVISQGLLPNSHAGQLQECAAGDFDQHWQNFGSMLTDKNREDSIVRLGWEFNGNWTSWAATNTQAWIDCYRTAAQNIRVTAPEVTFDWTIGAHWHSSGICGGVSTNCYPGDDVVDIIGIDNYDMGPSAATLAEFNQIAEAQEGLTWLYDFAMSRGKQFSVGEWGIAPGSEFNDTGENPPFIQWMHDWFAERTDNLAYEAYFNTCTPNDVQSNLHRPVSAEDNCVRLNENAGSLYQDLFGG